MSLAAACTPVYEVVYHDRYGRDFTAPAPISELRWGRKLDDISTASVTYTIPDDSCCESLGQLEPLAHSMSIRRNKELCWYGWLLNPEYSRNECVVDAFDALGWLKRRIIRSSLVLSDDLADIFLALWNDAILIDPIQAEVYLYPTGITQNRETQASDNRMAWNTVQEMLDTGLDVTAYGQHVLAGVIPTIKPLEIGLNDVEGDIRVTKYGNGYANRVIVDANAATEGVYPTGPATGNAIYPLVETVLHDGQIQDGQSAQDAAKARYEYSRYVPRLVTARNALSLTPNIDYEINDLIPGMKVIVDTTGLCFATKQEMRLGSLDVTVSSGVEKVSVSLQPSGPDEGLDSADDPIA